MENQFLPVKGVLAKEQVFFHEDNRTPRAYGRMLAKELVGKDQGGFLDGHPTMPVIS